MQGEDHAPLSGGRGFPQPRGDRSASGREHQRPTRRSGLNGQPLHRETGANLSLAWKGVRELVER
jgi:hypothetical protein